MTEWEIAYGHGRTKWIVVPVFCEKAGHCDCIRPGQFCHRTKVVEVPDRQSNRAEC